MGGIGVRRDVETMPGVGIRSEEEKRGVGGRKEKERKSKGAPKEDKETLQGTGQNTWQRRVEEEENRNAQEKMYWE